jgi:hypothetical protein
MPKLSHESLELAIYKNRVCPKFLAFSHPPASRNRIVGKIILSKSAKRIHIDASMLFLSGDPAKRRQWIGGPSPPLPSEPDRCFSIKVKHWKWPKMETHTALQFCPQPKTRVRFSSMFSGRVLINADQSQCGMGAVSKIRA